MPDRVVVRQAMRALLMPPLRPPPALARADHAPDSTMAAAATWSGAPLLVETGPGKSATLVHRVRHLLDSGVAAPAILVLTFLNRAAAELRCSIG